MELFSNFFLSHVENGVPSDAIRLSNATSILDAVHAAMNARAGLRRVYVVYSTASEATEFLNTLFARYGKVDYGRLTEVRAMHECVFLH